VSHASAVCMEDTCPCTVHDLIVNQMDLAWDWMMHASVLEGA
jgi:hypothetical protein